MSALLLPGPRMIGNVGFDIDTLLFGAMAILIGFQSDRFRHVYQGLRDFRGIAAGRSAPLAVISLRDPGNRPGRGISAAPGRNGRVGARPGILAEPQLRPTRSSHITSNRNSRVGVFYAGISGDSFQFFPQRPGDGAPMSDAGDLFDQYAAAYEQALSAAIAPAGESREYFAEGRVAWLKRCLREAKQTPQGSAGLWLRRWRNNAPAACGARC